MKEVFSEKSLTASRTEDEDLELINTFSRRALGSDEVYTFSLVLCDNEIDRDFEQFTPEALEALAEMFVGKTGIFDHSLKSRDQTARIFKTNVEKVEGVNNSLGQQYYKLTAKAYMPRTEKNAPIIAEIDAGILKEVSVGCSVGSITCSVCGADVSKTSCEHRKGRSYSGKICCHVLSLPTDAYEWSFVAVPAQKNAGVSKKFNFQNEGGAENMTNVLEKIKEAENGVTLSRDEAREIADRIEKAEKNAAYADAYLNDLKDSVTSLCPAALPEMDGKIIRSIAEKLDADELLSLKKAFSGKLDELYPPTVQLAPKSKKAPAQNHNEFKI